MGCPWIIKDLPTVEVIPSQDHVLRQIHILEFPKDVKPRRHPNEAHFNPSDDGLSVNWDKYCSVNDNHVIIGISHSKSGKFLETSQFFTLKFNVGFLREIPDVQSVEHAPVYYGGEPPIGSPNNISHSLVKYPDTKPKVRVFLADWVKDNFESVYIKQDSKIVNATISEIRNRLENPNV